MTKTPKPIRRGDGKILKFAGYNVPLPNEVLNSEEQIAMSLQRLMQKKGMIDPRDDYKEDDDDIDFGIDMNQYLQD